MDVRSFPGRLVVLTFAISWMAVPGCGPSGDAPAGESASGEATALQDPEKLLVGTWYGKARLDQGLLQKKLDGMSDPVQRQMLLNVSRTFQTTEIGAEFGVDGSMTLDIQVQSAGQTLRDSTRGNWRTLKVEGNAIFVETTEPLPQGGTETNQVRYQFEQDGRLAIMVAPTSDQLADCNPVFVFERVEAVGLADGADPGGLK
jgi:hypothetical protein